MRIKVNGVRAAAKFLLTSGVVLCCVALSCSKSGSDPQPEPKPDPDDNTPTPITWTKPSHFPDPVYDISSNPLTAEGVELGRYLFYDGILSRTGNIGCGTCHQQVAAFTHHGHDLSHGVDDLLGTRNAPSVQNMAWGKTFFWDGGVHNLDLVPPVPIQNPVEMDERVSNILAKLRKTPVAGAAVQVDYPKMFKAAFGSDSITSERFIKAISQFMLTLVSATSRYDYYVQGDASALTSLEKEGLFVFKTKCATCHAGELFTDESFRNNGLPPNRINDQGRYAITLNENDRLKFKVPSLRNVAMTQPYMHDGRFYTLDEVLNHYANDQATETISKSATLDPLLQQGTRAGIPLTATEKQAVIAFLRTLTDEQFIKNTRFADPGVGTAF